MDVVLSEMAMAIVLKPSRDAAILGAGDGVDVAIAIDVADRQRMRPGEGRVDLVRGPMG